MENLQKIALLIDADNTQLSKMEAVLREISIYGRIVVKRAYGNWRKDSLKSWESELKRLAIRAEQQFDYTTGKNATDIALTIDAINLLHRDIYDAFVIVSSDSDFTPLAISIHESGVYVIGVGEKKTPIAFRNSCDNFIYLENLDKPDEPPPQPAAAQKSAGAGKGQAKPAEKTQEADSIQEIHDLLKMAFDTYQEDDGYVTVGFVGQFIKRAKPDFDVRTYGFKTLTQLVEAFPERYVMKRYSGKGTTMITAYQCKTKKKQPERGKR
ncbi:MAG: NYN domain-containing protein [Oscillospiraceae bacterium]|nr:NYN domain-containing protein [Oscillospiraceae bacterium]